MCTPVYLSCFKHGFGYPGLGLQVRQCQITLFNTPASLLGHLLGLIFCSSVTAPFLQGLLPINYVYVSIKHKPC